MKNSLPPTPTFLFIGPDKAGSSWLFEILSRHPECYVPPCKDIYFFDRYYQRGLDWYLSFFAEAPTGVKAIGELSHDYLFSPAAARRIASDLHGVQLITSLRRPAERTFSHYLYMVRSGRTRLPFEQALEKFPELIRNSLYYQHLSRYFEVFPKNQIKVLLFDDLQRDPEGYARTVFVFLGLSFIPGLPYHDKVRAASRPRSHALARLAKLGANAARDLGLVHLVGTVKHSRIAGMLYTPYSAAERPQLEPDIRQRLAGFFHDDIKRTEALVGRDLSGWLADSVTTIQDGGDCSVEAV